MEKTELELRVQKTFDTVAKSYDHPGTYWFDLTARQLAKEAELKRNAQALDVATGTGKVALALASSEVQAEVVGTDLSSGMLEVATKKAASLGITNVKFQESSFGELAFQEHFDVLTCSFGIFFVEEMAETLRHFAKQVKPGGKLLLSTFSLGSFEPFNGAFVKLYREYGFEVPPPPWLRVASPALMEDLFIEAGLSAPKVTEHDFSLELSSPQNWWDIVYNAGYRGMLQRLDEADAEAFRVTHLKEVEELMASTGSKLDVRVLISNWEK